MDAAMDKLALAAPDYKTASLPPAKQAGRQHFAKNNKQNAAKTDNFPGFVQIGTGGGMQSAYVRNGLIVCTGWRGQVWVCRAGRDKTWVPHKAMQGD